MSLALEYRDARFSRGVVCPRCQAKSVRWHGKDRKGRQRYLCTSCKRTFTDRTGTPMERTHKPELWERFANCMKEHYSCRRTAQELGIDHKTAFFWRHKLAHALRSKVLQSIDGVCEGDETYVVRSYKGSRAFKRGQMNRPPRKLGPDEGAISRGLGKDQVAVMVVRNRDGATISQVMDQVSKDALLAAFGTVFQPQSILCSDGSAAIAAFAREKKLEHHALNTSKKERRRGEYHLNNVNGYHSRFKGWLRPFNGVPTRYLPNYVAWHVFFDTNKELLFNALNLPYHSSKVPQTVTCPDCGTVIQV